MTSPAGSRLPIDVILLRSIFDAVEAAVYVVDGNGVIRASNPKAEQILGYGEADLVGHPAHDRFHYVDAIGARRPAAECPILAVTRSGVADFDDNDVFVASDGALVPVAWSASPLVTSEGLAGAVVAFRDITVQVAAGIETELALEHAQRVQAESKAEIERVRFLADVSAALTSTLEPDETLRRLARLVVPRFADWCVVDLRVGDDVRRVSIAHRLPECLGAKDSREHPTFPLPVGAIGDLGRVLHGGPSVLTDGRADMDGVAESELERHQQELLSRFGAASVIIVGLHARHRTLGALTLVRTDPSSTHQRSDLLMADDVARRAALALDNARLYSQQRLISETLQHSLLPELPTGGDIALCATYVAATTGTEIGGDWYDSFTLPDGTTTLVLGDVAGHDLHAAVRMSDIRGLLRSASLLSSDPALVMANLDRAMSQFTPGVTATAIFARIERLPDRSFQLRWTNAGHPPPLLVSADGAAEYLTHDSDPLLGTGAGIARTSAVIPLPPGATVVLYSDGLIEDRATGVELGMARVRRTAAGLATTETGLFCGRLVEGIGTDWDDDVAVIAARTP